MYCTSTVNRGVNSGICGCGRRVLQLAVPPRVAGLMDGETVTSSGSSLDVASELSGRGGSVLSEAATVWLPPHVQAAARALLLLASCRTPLKAIHDVVVAFFLLLDEPENMTHGWSQCRAILKFYGGSARGLHLLRTRMQDVEEGAHWLDAATVARAGQLLAQYSPDVVQRMAHEATPLYNWAREMLARQPARTPH